MPSFPVGDPGWQSSTTPICETHQGLQTAFDVWADARGAFAMLSTDCNVLADVPCGKEGLSLQFNDGTGWSLVYQVPPGSGSTRLQLSGIPGGPLLVSGALDGSNGVWAVDDGTSELLTTTELGRPFGVSRDLAYAAGADHVYRFTSGSWEPFVERPSEAGYLWADEETLVIVGNDQGVYRKGTADDAFVLIPDAPAGNYTAVWGFGASDLWLGNQAGQLVHYDGSTFDIVETGSSDSTGFGIQQLWGSDGKIFFRTATEFGVADGGNVELVIAPTSGDAANPRFQVGGIWGRSATEVFVAVADKHFAQYACGGQFMLWFDGSELHAF